MKKKSLSFDKIKKIITASVTGKRVEDIYKSDGVGVRVMRSANSVSLTININTSKYMIENIIDHETIITYRNLANYLRVKHNIDVSSLSEEDKKRFESLQKQLFLEYDKLASSDYKTLETDEASIEYSQILASLLNSFLIEEVEKIKTNFNNYSATVEKSVQEFVNSLKDETHES